MNDVAAFNGHEDIIELLLMHGANANIIAKNGNDAMFYGRCFCFL